MKIEYLSFSLTIDAFDREQLIGLLEQALEDMRDHGDCCSMHPCDVEPYMPHMYYSVHSREFDVSQEWLDYYKKWDKDSLKRIKLIG